MEVVPQASDLLRGCTVSELSIFSPHGCSLVAVIFCLGVVTRDIVGVHALSRVVSIAEVKSAWGRVDLALEERNVVGARSGLDLCLKLLKREALLGVELPPASRGTILFAVSVGEGVAGLRGSALANVGAAVVVLGAIGCALADSHGVILAALSRRHTVARVTALHGGALLAGGGLALFAHIVSARPAAFSGAEARIRDVTADNHGWLGGRIGGRHSGVHGRLGGRIGGRHGWVHGRLGGRVRGRHGRVYRWLGRRLGGRWGGVGADLVPGLELLRIVRGVVLFIAELEEKASRHFGPSVVVALDLLHADLPAGAGSLAGVLPAHAVFAAEPCSAVRQGRFPGNAVHRIIARARLGRQVTLSVPKAQSHEK